MRRGIFEQLEQMEPQRRTYLLTSLVSHLLASRKWGDIAQLLTDLDFLHAKSMAGYLNQLIGEYSLAQQELVNDLGLDYTLVSRLKPCLTGLLGALNQTAHFVGDHPSAAAQELYNNLFSQISPDEAVEDMLRAFVAKGGYPGGLHWMRRISRSWQATTAQFFLRQLSDQRGRITALAVSPSGEYIATGGIDGSIVIWSRADSSIQATFLAHAGGVTQIRWHTSSADEAELVSIGRDQQVRCWCWPTAHERVSWQAHDGRIRDLVLLDDRQVATCGDDRYVRIWDLQTGRQQMALLGHVDRVHCLASDQQGKILVSGSEDGSVKVWDVSAASDRFTLRGHTSGVRCVAIAPGGRWAVSGADDRSLRIWDLSEGRELNYIPNAHENRISGVSIAVKTNDDRWAEQTASLLVISGGADEQLKIWEPQTGDLLQSSYGHLHGVTGISVAPKGGWFASAANDGAIRLWTTRLPQRQHKDGFEHSARINQIVAVDDGSRFVTVSDDGLAAVWHVSESLSHSLNLRGHLGPVICATMASDTMAVTGGSDTTLQIWDINTGSHIRAGSLFQNLGDIAPRYLTTLGLQTTNGHHQAVLCLTPANSGYVASGGVDRSVRLWDIQEGREVAAFKGARGTVSSVVYSQRHSLIFGAGSGREIALWHRAQPESVQFLEGHSGGITGLSLIDDNLLVSTSRDHSLRLWQLDRLGASTVLSGHSDWVTCVDVFRAANMLISGGRDGTLRMWDLQSGTELGYLSGHRASIRLLAVDQHTGRLFSCADDRTLIAWDLGSAKDLLRVNLGAPPTAITLLSSTHLAIGSRYGSLAVYEFV